MKIKYLIILFFVFIAKINFGQGVELVIQKGHLAPVTELAFHENNKYLASSDERNNTIVWDIQNGKEIVRFKDSSDVTAIDFLSSTDVLITGNSKGQIKYYNIFTGELDFIIGFGEKIKKLMHFGDKILVVSNKLYAVDFENEEIVELNDIDFEDIQYNPDKIEFTGYTETRQLFTLDSLFEVKQGGLLQSVGLFNRAEKNNPANKVREKVIGLNLHNGTFSYVKFGALQTSELFSGKNKLKKVISCTPSFIAINSTGNKTVIGDESGAVFIFDDKKVVAEKKMIQQGKIRDIKFSYDNRYFATASDDYTIVIWSSIDNQAIHDLNNHALPIYALDIDKKTNRLFIGQDQGFSSVIDLKSKLDLTNIDVQNNHTGVVSDVKFVGDKMISSGFDNNITIYDINKKRVVRSSRRNRGKRIERTKSYGDEFIYSIQPSQNGNELLLIKGKLKDGKLIQIAEVIDTSDFRVSFQEEDAFFEVPVRFRYNGSDYYYIPNFNHESWGTKNYANWLSEEDVLLSAQTEFGIFKKQGDSLDINSNYVELKDEVSAVCKPNKDKFFFAMEKSFYSMNKMEPDYLRKINEHQDVITDIVASQDKIFTSSFDGSIKIWDLTLEELVATLVPFNDNSMLIFTPDNYYLSINGGHKNVGFKFGSSYVPFENYDLKFNRPDIVLKRLGFADQSTIDLLKKSYENRIRKFGFHLASIDETFNLPEIAVSNQNKIPFATEESTIELNIEAKDELANIDRINIWVNGNPVYGMNGFAANKQKNIRIQPTINLANGKNKIEISAINVSGAESLRKSFEILCNKDKVKPDLYVISIGVQEFKDKNYNLSYASKDADDVTTYFEGTNFNKVQTIKLTNDLFNKNELNKVKKELFNTKPEDQVVLFIATHGVIDANYDYFFATQEMDFNNPSDGGIRKSDIDQLLDSIPAQNKIMLVDACHSGEIDKDAIAEASNEEFMEDITFRSAGKNIKYKSVDAKKVSELEALLFEDHRKGNGASILTSSSGVQLSMESKEWQNGLFTYGLLKGLSKKELNLDKLFDETYNVVSKLSKGLQTPTIRSRNKNVSYRFK